MSSPSPSSPSSPSPALPSLDRKQLWTFVLPIVALLSRQIDWTVEGRTGMLLTTFIISQLAFCLVFSLIKKKIEIVHDKTPVFLTKSELKDNSKSSVTTVYDYDLQKVNETLRNLVLLFAAFLVLHFQFKLVLPLFTQLFFGTVKVVQNKLFQIYLLSKTGSEFNRPWAEEEKNPLTSALDDLKKTLKGTKTTAKKVPISAKKRQVNKAQ
eukprot:TRINITY_DN2228_c0_g1_i2.p1 TRINITY_DN2228_c0_g1~~TRINITY_DN2228_c0_g1_i2.p1  ORF type:complete len:231 (+),score=80.02 TRINITY_DN2228_c0_g1_i2:65-694(+)